MAHLLYLDPGSTSYIVQAIVAGVLGGLFFIKNFWYRIKAFFTGIIAVVFGGLFSIKNFRYRIKAFFTGKKKKDDQDTNATL